MGLCASKDKKEKVIEGEVANGEPNGTATAAGAGGDGCVSRSSGLLYSIFFVVGIRLLDRSCLYIPWLGDRPTEGGWRHVCVCVSAWTLLCRKSGQK